MLKKLVLSLLIVASVITVMPMGVSAEWKMNDTGWLYKEESTYYTGWKQINGSWYYFGRDYYMKTGWIKDESSWYYLKSDGAMVIGKLTIDGKVYEFDNNGRWINSNDSTPTPLQNKLQVSPNFSWLNDKENTFFKTKDIGFLTGAWTIDEDKYIFDNNGVMQKGEYTLIDGTKYLFGNDGKYIKCITNDKYDLTVGGAITTKSTSDTDEIEIDDSHMMNITRAFSKNGGRPEGIKVEGKTLYCRAMQAIELGAIKVKGTDTNSSSLPKLMIRSNSSDKDVAFSEVSTNLKDGVLENIIVTIYANKVGKTTITLNVNGTKTSFDLVVTE